MPTTTTLKPGTEYLFTNPLRSMMAILPVAFLGCHRPGNQSIYSAKNKDTSGEESDKTTETNMWI
jgi:hypothetical protein